MPETKTKKERVLEAIKDPQRKHRLAGRYVALSSKGRGEAFLDQRSHGMSNLRNVRAKRALENDLKAARNDAAHDGLTGLLTRKYGDEQGVRLFSAVRRYNNETHKRVHQSIAIIFVDLDHFKKVNDSLGHLAGDAVLKSVAGTIERIRKEDLSDTAGTIKKNLRAEAVALRYGGEEFAVIARLQPATNPETGRVYTAEEQGMLLAKRLHGAIGETRTVLKGSDNSTFELIKTASIGVAIMPVAPDDITTEKELLNRGYKQADVALYKAKETRNCIVMSDGTTEKPRAKTPRIEKEAPIQTIRLEHNYGHVGAGVLPAGHPRRITLEHNTPK